VRRVAINLARNGVRRARRQLGAAWAPAPRVTVHRDGVLVAGDAP